jgi:hypothetical protein
MSAIRFLLASVALAAAIGIATGEAARSSGSCVRPSVVDRSPTQAGRVIRVIYAIGADGVDNSDAWRGVIAGDLEEITSWWRGHDPAREPRFDLVAAACGRVPDVHVLRLPESQLALAPLAGRAGRITRSALALSSASPFEKLLVYYDGPVAPGESPRCGQGGGEPDGAATAIVFVAACPAVRTEVVAAHELVHALGGAPRQGPPHACAGSTLHVCDSALDLLSPVASHGTLDDLRLDSGNDDYYGHDGSWPDLQDSRWLRRIDGQVRLVLDLSGQGRVRSNLPGMNCRAACVTEWDAGTVVSLHAVRREGVAFLGWTGACGGEKRCDLVLKRDANVRARFAPER